MRGKLTVDHNNNKIIMDRTFAKYEKDTFSEEYAHLQQVRKDYPTYRVELRKIKRNSDKETYKGLTYDYMREYIFKHEPAETRRSVLMEFEDMIFNGDFLTETVKAGNNNGNAITLNKGLLI